MEQHAQSRVIESFLIEDDPGDVRLTKEALRESILGNYLHVVGNGVDAMDFLYRPGSYGEATRPDLILLDPNLPKKDGRETFAEIKSHALLKRIPVFLHSTSRADGDIRRSYELHANCYVGKPVRLDEFLNVMWQKTVHHDHSDR